MRTVLTLAVALLTLTLVPFAAAAPKGVVGVIGAGDFGTNGPRGVAVNETTGDVYVADGGGHRVRRYSAGGTFLSQLGSGSSSNLKGNFNTPSGVAVDPATGAVWVSDAGNLRLQKLDPPDVFGTHAFNLALGWDVITGAPTSFEVCGAADTCKQGVAGANDGQFAGTATTFTGHLAVDSAGRVYVADPVNRRVQRFDGATGAFQTKFGNAATFAASSPTRVAVDSAGAVYVVEAGSNRVQKCFSTGGDPEGFSCTTFAGSQVSGKFPFAIAIDRDDAHVYVAIRSDDPATSGVSQDEIHVVELEPDGDLVAVHAQGGGITTTSNATSLNNFGGLAVNSTTDTLYLAVPHGSSASRRVYALADTPAGGSTQPATDVTATEATLSATVDPNGVATTFHFETSDDDGATWKRVVPAAHSGSETGDLAVTQPVSGLEPNREIRVRLVASRPFNPDVVLGAEETLTTQPAPPNVTAYAAARITQQSARLDGSVDPNSDSTSYRFEYGTDATYGAQIPLSDGPVGDDPTAQPVSQKLVGLEPGTTYHFRLVATSSSGSAATDDQTFTTRTSAPTGGRVWEQVTHAGESAGLVGPDGIFAWSLDGNRAMFGSIGVPLDEDDLTGVFNAYGAERTGAGWEQWRLTPRIPGPQDGDPFGLATPEAWSSDFEQAIWISRRTLSPDVPFTGEWRHFKVGRGGAPVESLGLSGESPQMWGASPDARSVLISTTDSLTPDDTPGQISPADVYVKEDGVARLVGTKPGGGTFSCGSDWGPGRDPRRVSEDWSRIFFDGEDCGSPGRVYMSAGGASVEVAASQCQRGDCNVAQPVEFMAAGVDGARVLVLSAQQLTDDDVDATEDLYLYDVASGDLDRISAPTGGPGGGDVLGILGASDDLDRVYFASRGALTPDPDASAGAPNLYVWDGDGLRHVAVLSDADGAAWSPDLKGKQAEVTPDGRWLAFASSAALTSGDVDSSVDVYLFEATGETLTKVSFGERGSGDAGIDASLVSGAGRMMRQGAVSADGSRVFFQTAEALVPEDLNDLMDIYESHDGAVSLVSSGSAGRGEVWWAGASSDGSTVFVLTAESLAETDLDNGAEDIYAARVDGGFSSTAPPSPCEGDSCQSEGTAPPPPSMATEAFDGDRNTRPVTPVRAIRARIRGFTAVLRVRVSGAGRVVISGRGLRTRRIGVPRAGTYRVKLSLRAPARRRLLRRGVLAARTKVVFLPRQGASSRARLKLTFKARRAR